jgi:hypothetical protein
MCVHQGAAAAITCHAMHMITLHLYSLQAVGCMLLDEAQPLQSTVSVQLQRLLQDCSLPGRLPPWYTPPVVGTYHANHAMPCNENSEGGHLPNLLPNPPEIVYTIHGAMHRCIAGMCQHLGGAPQAAAQVKSGHGQQQAPGLWLSVRSTTKSAA